MNTAQPYAPRKNSVAFNAIAFIAEKEPVTTSMLMLETATDNQELQASLNHAIKAGIVARMNDDQATETLWKMGPRADLLAGEIVMHLPTPGLKGFGNALPSPADEPKALVDLTELDRVLEAHKEQPVQTPAASEEEDLSGVTVIQVFEQKVREIAVLDSPRALLFSVGSDGSVRITVDNTEDSMLFEPQRAAELYAWFERCAMLLAPLARSRE